MLTSGRFWGGVVVGVLMVYGYNMYRAKQAR
jgi:hypothetical protein